MRRGWGDRWQKLQLLARPRQPEALPRRLDRRRIYVLPTRFGMFVTTLLVAMLLGALNYNNNPALLLALLLATVAIASTISAHLQLSGLQIDAVSAEPVHAGQPMRLRISLSRPDARARRGLELALDQAVAFGHLLDTDQIEVDLMLPTVRRGWLDLTRIRISTTQPLGLVRAWSWVWPDAPLLVYAAPELQAPALPESGGDPLHTACMPAAMSCINCAPTARATRRAASPGSTRPGATPCWCASMKNRSAWTCCWTGGSWPRCRSKHASRGWRAGWTSPSAMAAATPCSCPGSRYWGLAMAAPTTTCANAHWR